MGGRDVWGGRGRVFGFSVWGVGVGREKFCGEEERGCGGWCCVGVCAGGLGGREREVCFGRRGDVKDCAGVKRGAAGKEMGLLEIGSDQSGNRS